MSDMVDPQRSIAARTQAHLLGFLESFLAHTWDLLNSLGPADWHARQDVMLFARRQLVRMKPELFRRGDIHLSSFFNRLQWIGSRNAIRAILVEFVDKFLRANYCCLGASGARARRWLRTRER